MAQKFGGALGGAAVLWLLSASGYETRTDDQMSAALIIQQPQSALLCLRCLMSLIPAAVALIAAIICHHYPLTTHRVEEINTQLHRRRTAQGTTTPS